MVIVLFDIGGAALVELGFFELCTPVHGPAAVYS